VDVADLAGTHDRLRLQLVRVRLVAHPVVVRRGRETLEADVDLPVRRDDTDQRVAPKPEEVVERIAVEVAEDRLTGDVAVVDGTRAGEHEVVVSLRDPLLPRAFAPFGPHAADKDTRLVCVEDRQLVLGRVDDVIVLAVDDVVLGACDSERAAIRHLVDVLDAVVPDHDVVEDQRLQNRCQVDVPAGHQHSRHLRRVNARHASRFPSSPRDAPPAATPSTP
jgi:hypothetical protein